MKKILVFITLLIIPTIIMAEECSNEELVRLKTLASKAEFKLIPFEFSYVLTDADTGEDITYKDNAFEIYVNNMDKDLNYLIQEQGYAFADFDSKNHVGEKEFSLKIYKGYEEIRKFNLYIFSNDNCGGKLLRTDTVTLPKKNNNYALSMCEGIEDFYLCNEFLYQDYNVSNIKNLTEKYRKGQIDNKGNKKEKKSFIEWINSFSKKYALPLIIVVVVIGGAVAFVNVKRYRRIKKHFDY